MKKKLLILGSTGMVGSSLLRIAKKKRIYKILNPNRKKLDLKKFNQIVRYLKKFKPDVIVNCAAMVGGVHSNNTKPAQFIYNNLVIQTNLIHAAYKGKIKKLIFLGSSCIYPRNSKQPIKEDYLLSGYLEKTNEPYAIAKIAGIKMCESYNYQHNTNYFCLMPCNAFGPNDNYDLLTSHFFPALIRRLSDAIDNKKKSIKLWGTGKAKREFIYVDDIADACIFFMNKKVRHALINIGSEEEHTISQCAKKVLKKFDKKIQIKFDNNKKMDGTPRKILDCSLARSYGWKKKISFEDGLELTLNDFFKRKGNFRKIKF